MQQEANCDNDKRVCGPWTVCTLPVYDYVSDFVLERIIIGQKKKNMHNQWD